MYHKNKSLEQFKGKKLTRQNSNSNTWWLFLSSMRLLVYESEKKTGAMIDPKKTHSNLGPLFLCQIMETNTHIVTLRNKHKHKWTKKLRRKRLGNCENLLHNMLYVRLWNKKEAMKKFQEIEEKDSNKRSVILKTNFWRIRCWNSQSLLF